jgi:hypothetical protein
MDENQFNCRGVVIVSCSVLAFKVLLSVFSEILCGLDMRGVPCGNVACEVMEAVVSDFLISHTFQKEHWTVF